MPDASNQTVTIEGKSIKLTNLGKVLYPETETTKADVIGYYAAVAEVMLPHLFERPATRKRWPNGVGDDQHKPLVFFTKDLDSGTPDWVTRRKIKHRDHDNLYPVVDDLPPSPGSPSWPRWSCTSLSGGSAGTASPSIRTAWCWTSIPARA